MDQNQENTTENVAPVETPPETAPATYATSDLHDDHASKNLIIIAVLAVIVIVLAMLYVWGSTAQVKEEVLPDPLPAEDAQLQGLQQVSASDDIASIEEDLNTTELDALDAELDQMIVELDAAGEANVQ